MIGELANQAAKNMGDLTGDLFERSNLASSSLEGMPTRNVPGMQIAAQSLPIQPNHQVMPTYQPRPDMHTRQQQRMRLG